MTRDPLKILIAEDNQTNRAVLDLLLRRWGHSVTAVSDGAQAWDVLQGPDAPDFAILDWMMPGMSGPEVCRKLRAQNNECFVVILTANSEADAKREVANAGADLFLTKPISIPTLREALEQYSLRRPRQFAEAIPGSCMRRGNTTSWPIQAEKQL